MEKDLQLDAYRNGTKIKPVTSAPGWFLWLRGKIDAGKGDGVAKAHIMHFLDKCTELEALECLYAEELLCETRKQGADALASIRINEERVLNFPGLLNGNSPHEIRENARRQSIKNNAENSITESKRKLFPVYEIIANGETVLHERIIKTRKKASEVIDLYIKGVRAGGLKTFDMDIIFSDKAIEDYHNRHKRTDEAISRFVFEEGGKAI